MRGRLALHLLKSKTGIGCGRQRHMNIPAARGLPRSGRSRGRRSGSGSRHRVPEFVKSLTHGIIRRNAGCRNCRRLLRSSLHVSGGRRGRNFRARWQRSGEHFRSLFHCCAPGAFRRSLTVINGRHGGIRRGRALFGRASEHSRRGRFGEVRHSGGCIRSGAGVAVGRRQQRSRLNVQRRAARRTDPGSFAHIGVVAAHLRHHHVRKADAARVGDAFGEFLIVHGHPELFFLALHQPFLGKGSAHLFPHLLDED